MEMGLEKEFLNLIEDYKTNPSILENIRKYILKKTGTPNIEFYVNYFTNVTNEMNEPVGIALSHAMQFWLYAGSNLNYSIEQNQISKELYQKLPNYEKAIGYLTTLNNQLISYNLKGDLKNAYDTASEAFRIARDEHSISYLVAFSVNFVSILNELGLYQKAYQTLCEADNILDDSSLSTKVVILRLKVSELILLDRYIDALAEMERIKDLRKGQELFQDLLFEYEKIYIYTKLDDIVKANQMYEIIQEKLKTFIVSREINNIYHMIARYLVYIKDYEKALEYYEYVYNNLNIYHGYRRIALIEISNLYEKLGYTEKALKTKNEAISLLSNSMNVVTSILSDESGLYSDKFANLAYHELYNMTDILNSFFNKLSSHLNFIDINKELGNTIHLLDSNSMYRLIVYNNIENCYIYFDNNKEFKVDFLNKINLDNRLTNKINLLSNDKEVGYLFLDDIIYHNPDIGPNNLTKLYNGLANAISSHISFEKIEYESNHDLLTGLLTRRGFKFAQDATNITNYFVIALDIDDFKNVNDHYGHPAGDEVIIGVASILIKHLGNDFLARIGGDEFLAVRKGSKDILEKKLKKLVDEIANTEFNYKDKSIMVTISIGAKYCEKDFSDAYKEADEILYKIKSKGKNSFSIIE